MNSIDFCFWLQGYFEISNSEDVTPEQVRIIKNHLNLTFKHEIDPLREGETPTPAQELNTIHNSILNNDTLIRC